MPDLPDNRFTSASLSSSGTLTSAIETAGDRDWVRVSLVGGTSMQFNVLPSGTAPLEDSVLRLYDAGGRLLAENDDFGDSLLSQLRYQVREAGTYYLEVSGYDLFETGGYQLTSARSDLPPVLEALDWSTEVAGPEVAVYFAPRGETFDGYTSEGFNSYEQARFAASFELIEAVTGLEFVVVDRAAGADFRLVLDTNEDTTGFQAYFIPPGEKNAGVGLFDGTQWDRFAGGDLEPGGYSFATVTHELLHGLGLAHPHDDGGGSPILAGVTADTGSYGQGDLNQGIFTTMSYNTGFYTGGPGSEGDRFYRWGYEIGPMALDIALLQAKYGVNTTTAIGDTSYTLPTANQSGTGWQAIWDVTGVDEIRANPQDTQGVTIDLRAATLRAETGGGGFVSAEDGVAGGFTIAAGVVIENATGGAGDDRLYGNSANNSLSGGAGNDRFYIGQDTGLSGYDKLDGGTGFDRAIIGLPYEDLAMVSYNHITHPGQTYLTFVRSGDTDTVMLTGVERVDFLDGTTRGINQLIDLRPGAGVRVDGTGQISGTAGNDTLVGAEGADVLGGGLGDDTLVGKNGNDFYIVNSPLDIVREDATFSQGGGIDTVRAFVDYVQPENVELVRLGLYTDRSALEATGNDAPGTLVGNAGDNVLNARGGNDQVNGNGGDDVLIGGVGRDTLVGGTGADTFVYGSISESRSGAAARDLLNGFDPGADRIDLSAIDADTTTFGVDDAFDFVGVTAFSGQAGELRTQGLGGANGVLLEMDVTGDGAADMQILITRVTSLEAGDFIL